MSAASDNSESDSPENQFAGIDVGGTSIKIGVADEHGTVLLEKSIETDNESGPEDAICRIQNALQSTLDSDGYQLKGAGLGTPGPLNSNTGVILDPVNMPGWRNYPVRDKLAEALSIPVVYANDANAAAYGEYWMGNGAKHNSVVLLTLGTGVGGGVIVDGQLVSGANDLAAECGHIAVDYGTQARECSCGKRGHLEAYASATAVATRATELAALNSDSLLAELTKSGRALTARDVYDCALQDDQESLKLIEQTAEYLGRGIADFAHTIDPDIFILGGAMDFGGCDCEIGKRFLALIQQQVRELVFQRISDNLRIEFASLGGRAGWIGAAGLAKHNYDQTN